MGAVRYRMAKTPDFGSRHSGRTCALSVQEPLRGLLILSLHLAKKKRKSSEQLGYLVVMRAINTRQNKNLKDGTYWQTSVSGTYDTKD